jgi:hypothetical protein
VESDVASAGKVAQRAMLDGVRHVTGPGFEVSDPEPIKSELLAEAVHAARDKAERLAQAAGLGRVLWIRETGIELSGGGIYREMMLTSADQMTEPEIVASDQTISVDLVVAFEFAD